MCEKSKTRSRLAHVLINAECHVSNHRAICAVTSKFLWEIFGKQNCAKHEIFTVYLFV
jgi:hypothetical protein